MSKLIAYERSFLDYGGWEHSRIYPTGKCKRITTKDENGNVVYGYELAQCRRYLFGVPLWTHWVNKKFIVWRSKDIEYYSCPELKVEK
jgi:hypothetical protein